jgi:uncharacterized protein
MENANSKSGEGIIWKLFSYLRRLGFPVDIRDYKALYTALIAGFGWDSREHFIRICCALLAKSKDEEDVIRAFFNQSEFPDWTMEKKDRTEPDAINNHEPSGLSRVSGTENNLDGTIPDNTPDTQQDTENAEPNKEGTITVEPLQPVLPEIHIARYELLKKHMFIFLPQFPISYRQVVQAFRRLRKPRRFGPKTEIDIDKTIKNRCKTGISTPVVLVPRRRNITRLIVFVDRDGSMKPFHQFVQMIETSIIRGGRFAHILITYFHASPVDYPDYQFLQSISGQQGVFLPGTMINQIKPVTEGYVFEDPYLLEPVKLKEILENDGKDASIIIISDAGAAKGERDVMRVVNSLSFIKGIREFTHNYVWLNPLPGNYWEHSPAEQIARYVPMFDLTNQGINRAIEVLRGKSYLTERNL